MTLLRKIISIKMIEKVPKTIALLVLFFPVISACISAAKVVPPSDRPPDVKGHSPPAKSPQKGEIFSHHRKNNRKNESINLIRNKKINKKPLRAEKSYRSSPPKAKTPQLSRERSKSPSPRYSSYLANFHFLKGEFLSRKGRYRRALESFKSALVYDSASPYIYYKISRQLIELKAYKKAWLWAKRGLKLSPCHRDLLFALGEIAVKVKNYRVASRYWKRGLRCHPREKLFFSALDSLYRHKNPVSSERLALLKRMVRSLPSDRDALFRLGKFWELSGRYRRALRVYLDLLKIHPSDKGALFRSAMLLARLRDGRGFKKVFFQFIRYYPSSWRERLTLSALFSKFSEPQLLSESRFQLDYFFRENSSIPPPEKALLIAKTAANYHLFPLADRWVRKAHKLKSSPEISFWRALIALRRREFPTARKVIAKSLLKKDRWYWEFRALNLEMLFLLGDKTRAEANIRKALKTLSLREMGSAYHFFQIAIEYSPPPLLRELAEYLGTIRGSGSWWGRVRLLYALALYNLGRVRTALRVLERLRGAENIGGKAELLNFSAYLRAELRVELSAARGMIAQALLSEPDNPYFLDTLGWILFASGKFRLAAEVLSQSRFLVPMDPTVAYHLGLAYLKFSPGRGKSILKKVLELNPSPAILKKVRSVLR